MLLCFFSLFFSLHKPTLCACGWTCICAYMCCEWEQGHCWGLGFLSDDLLQASLHQKWAWISVIFHVLLPLSVELPARSRSCRECRIGTDEPSYGEILVRFLCFNPCFENAGLADFATPRASCQQDVATFGA